MEAYTDFAYLYDTFMEDVPYEEWAELLSSLIKAYADDVSNVCDLGCGTGTLTRMMNKRGYNMCGVDISEDMLSVAMDRQYEGLEDNADDEVDFVPPITYICQDMCELSLLESQDAIYSVCDCINYLITEKDVLACLKSVRKNLKKDGIFIYDFNTVYKYKEVIGNTTIAENREDASFIWENFYTDEDHINEYDVTFFTREENAEGEDLFRRFSETHIQRGYTLEEMKGLAKKAGFNYITALDEATRKVPTDTSERIYMILRK